MRRWTGWSFALVGLMLARGMARAQPPGGGDMIPAQTARERIQVVAGELAGAEREFQEHFSRDALDKLLRNWIGGDGPNQLVFPTEDAALEIFQAGRGYYQGNTRALWSFYDQLPTQGDVSQADVAQLEREARQALAQKNTLIESGDDVIQVFQQMAPVGGKLDKLGQERSRDGTSHERSDQITVEMKPLQKQLDDLAALQNKKLDAMQTEASKRFVRGRDVPAPALPLPPAKPVKVRLLSKGTTGLRAASRLVVGVPTVIEVRFDRTPDETPAPLHVAVGSSSLDLKLTPAPGDASLFRSDEFVPVAADGVERATPGSPEPKGGPR